MLAWSITSRQLAVRWASDICGLFRSAMHFMGGVPGSGFDFSTKKALLRALSVLISTMFACM